MIPLLLTLAAQLAAPVLDRFLHPRTRTAAFGDGLVQMIVAGLLLVHVVPAGLIAGGWPALVALVVGLSGGLFAHRLPGGERSVAGLALLGLVVHGLGDGAALATSHHAMGAMLSASVVLHTLPVALATWRIAVRYAGLTAGILALAVTVASTVGGFAAADLLLDALPPAAIGVVQCGVAGALLHVVGHIGSGRSGTSAAGVGALAGVGVVLLIGATHGDHDETSPWASVGHLAMEAAPALLIGYLAAGGLHAFAPASLGRWLKGGTAVETTVRGALVGVAVPVCSCGALPVYRTMHHRGVDPRAGLAFLVAGPEIGIGTLLVSVPLLGGPMTALRLGAAVGGAVAAGLLVGGRVAPAAPVVPEPQEALPARARVREALRFGLVETVDHTAVWVLAGLWVAALVQPFVGPALFQALPAGAGVVLAAAVGVPLYVCASGATPLVASLMAAGLSPGAALAFLLTGPATNLATFGILRQMHGPTVALGFGAVVSVTAIGIGLAVDRWTSGLGAAAVAAAETHPHGVVEWAAMLALAALFGASLVRQGPVGFADALLRPIHDHDDPHDHDHHHGHGHHDHGHGHPG